jgi:hypothetical protein
MASMSLAVEDIQTAVLLVEAQPASTVPKPKQSAAQQFKARER